MQRIPIAKANDDLRVAAQAELLSGKALRYKRNGIVLALIASAIQLLPFIDISGLNLVGIHLENDAPSTGKIREALNGEESKGPIAWCRSGSGFLYCQSAIASGLSTVSGAGRKP